MSYRATVSQAMLRTHARSTFERKKRAVFFARKNSYTAKDVPSHGVLAVKLSKLDV